MTSIPVDIRINLDLEEGEIVTAIGQDTTADGFDIWADSAIGRGARSIKRVIARVLPVPKDVFHSSGKRIKPGTLAYELAQARPEDVTMTPKRRARKAA